MKAKLLLAAFALLLVLAAGLRLFGVPPAPAPRAPEEVAASPARDAEARPSDALAASPNPSPLRPASPGLASRTGALAEQAPRTAMVMPTDAPREITGTPPVVIVAVKTPAGPRTPEQMVAADEARRAARRAAGYAKPDQPDEFERYHDDLRRPIGDDSDGPLPNYRQAALRALALDAPVAFGKTNGTVTWTERGPANVSGRTRALATDPADASASTWLVGAVGGGVWRTLDAGLTWADLTPGLPNLAVTALAQGVSNADVVYAGTGEGFGNVGGITGDGIWKSTDRGATWALLPSTNRFNGFGAVNRLLVDPADASIVLAATGVGVYRSANGGTSWTKVYESLSGSAFRRVQQIVAEPGNFLNQYAAVNGLGVARSINGGGTWTTSAALVGMRFELAISPSNPAYVYASAEVSTSVSDLFVSANRGATWGVTTQATPTNWLSGQGWYDNTIAVHPTDPSIVFVGGVDLFRLNTSTTPSSSRTDVTSVTSPSWTSPVNFGGASKPGVAYGSAIHGVNDVTPAELVDVEVRFGTGRSQMAHRFGGGASLAALAYQAYVSVPFQLWDVSNPGSPRQLAASFFDSDGNGVFNLSTANSEYIFVHTLDYDAAAANPALAVTGGSAKKNPYFLWYRLPTGGVWNAATLPTSAIVIDVTPFATYARTTTKLTNWYPNLARPEGGVYPYLHADQHYLTFVPRESGFRLLNGNDGGANYSDDFGATWTLTLNGYNSSQFYGVDKRAGVDQYIGGMQDNGTWRSPGGVASVFTTDWLNQIGGDGFSAIWHAENPSLLIGSVQFNAIRRSTNGGASYATATNGLTDTGSGTGGYFVTAIAKSASDPDLLLTTGNTGPFRSDNFAASWKKSTLTVPTSWRLGAGRAPAAVSTADPRVMWAGPAVVGSATPSNVQRIQVSTDGGVTFTPSAYITGVNAFVSGIAAHPTNRKKAYAAFSITESPKLYQTADLGATWTNISGTHSVAGQALSSTGFPNVATYSALVMPFDTLQIWAGTEIGLVVSNDGGASWGRPAFSFPAVSIWQMSIVDDQVVVATHGRGVWTATLSDLAGYAAPVAVRSPRLESAAQRPNGNIAIRYTRRSAYDSLVVFRAGLRQVNLGGNAAPAPVQEVLFPSNVMASGTVAYALTAYVGGQAYPSSAESVSVTATPAAVSFTSSLDAPADANAFAATGFSLATPAGFANSAFHSARGATGRYADNQTYTLQLRNPILVAETGATVVYDEIALVEPHPSAGAFYDYVLVEATKDGSTWLPLAERYDARYDAAWLARFNSNVDAGGNSLATGDPSLYRTHTVELGPNVQNTSAGREGGAAGRVAAGPFAVGDTVFVRFRMVTDGGSTGWGWSIDNVKVQESGVLPVELASFDAHLDGAAVRLRWATASETNNAGFAVERALDAAAEWAEIGAVAGAGTTSEGHAYTFADEAVPYGAVKVRYRLRQTDFDGATAYSAVIEMAVGVPVRFAVHDNFPNPVRGSTRIRYELPAAAHVRLTVYDVTGRLVARLVDERQEAGRREVAFDAAGLASGVYLYRVEAGANVATKQMTVVR